MRYYDKGEGAFLTLHWMPPDYREEIPDEHWLARGFRPLGKKKLYQLPFAGRGLLARYYDNRNHEGEPFPLGRRGGTLAGAPRG